MTNEGKPEVAAAGEPAPTKEPPETGALLRRFAAEAAHMLDWLAQFGSGANADEGVTRLLYTPAWQQAQGALAERLAGCGLAVSYDDVGNLYARLDGAREREVVATGSHIDTVVRGGRYVGAYGIVAGALALAYLKEAYGQPERTLQLVSFAEEEGSRFPLAFWGSGSVTGRYQARHAPDAADADGVSLAAAMHEAGFGQGRYAAPPAAADWSAFVELHIEQGSVLEREGAAIGIVQGIVGQRRFGFEVSGEANHAGTTPMSYRRDALCGAAEMIVAIRDAALAYGDPTVATVGRLEASPGTVNVVPGRASFTLDVRHPDGAALEAFCGELMTTLERIAASNGLTVSASLWTEAAPVRMNGRLTEALDRICRTRGLVCRHMYSGAGHDSQLLAPVCPTAMVFVPSRGGISHSPAEYTKAEDLAAGIVVLADLLYALAYKGETP